ncbi:hypothetical protein QLX08_005308 [Tetragonisca angustula]|uniref:Uncharacterized protein n=1 Tax=Tetragonisca angustula TaxID=166442 RepID=A0AAW1A0E4_9HYME
MPDKPAVGASWYCPAFNTAESISINNKISSYTAEALDRKALEAANKLADPPILVCSDALNTLQAITIQHSKSKNAYIQRTRKKNSSHPPFQKSQNHFPIGTR